MPTIIPSKHYAKISQACELKGRIESKYLTDNAHFATKFIVQMFLQGGTIPKDWNTSEEVIATQTKLRQLNQASGFWSIVSDKLAGGVGNATIPDKLDTYKHFDKNSEDLISIGVTGLEIVSDGSKYSLKYISGDEIVEWDTPTRYVYMEKERIDNGEVVCDHYLFVKKYYIGYNENKLYKLQKNSRSQGTQVDLSIYDPTMTEREDTGLSGYSLVIIKRRSKFKQLESLIFTFERNIVSISTQFLKHLEAFLILRWVNFASTDYNEDGTLKPQVIKKRILTLSDPQAAVEYVSLNNPTIDQTIKVTYENMIRQISAVSSVPAFYFGVADGAFSGQGGQSREIMVQDFVNECEKIRESFNEAIETIKDMLSIDGETIWGEVIKRTPTELIEEYKGAKDLWIISRKQMIMEYWGISEQDALKLIEEIDAENAKAQALAQELITKQSANVPQNQSWGNNPDGNWQGQGGGTV